MCWTWPPSISIARWQYSSTVDISWVTRTIVLPSRLSVVEGVGALLLEGGVPDRQHLVDQQHVGVGLQHRREGEPDQHPRGVVLQFQFDELLEFGELDHRVEPAARLLRRQAHHHAVEDHVFARRQVHVEADSELDEGGQGAGHADRPGVRPVDARQQLQQGALAGAVAADDREELALADVEGDAVERPQLAHLAGGEGVQHPLLQRVDLVGRDAERLLEVAGLDRERRPGLRRRRAVYDRALQRRTSLRSSAHALRRASARSPAADAAVRSPGRRPA